MGNSDTEIYELKMTLVVILDVYYFQELIGALLACAFFCLFPTSNRGAKHLPMINFDRMFAYVSAAVYCYFSIMMA